MSGKKAAASPWGRGVLPPTDGFPSSFRCVARGWESTCSKPLDSVAQNAFGGGRRGALESQCSPGAGGLVQARGPRVLRETVGAQEGGRVRGSGPRGSGGAGRPVGPAPMSAASPSPRRQAGAPSGFPLCGCVHPGRSPQSTEDCGMCLGPRHGHLGEVRGHR